MVKKCKVTNCPVKARTKVGQFSFPVKHDLCLKWIEACGLEGTFKPSVHSRVCEIHFKDEDFRPSDGKLRRRLKAGSVPSLNLVHGELTLEAQRIIDIQKEASVEAIEKAKRDLQNQREKEERLRKIQVESGNEQMPSTLSSALVSVCNSNINRDLQVHVERLENNKGFRLEFPVAFGKAPSKIGRIFRNENVKEFIADLADQSKRTFDCKRKKRGNKATFLFEIRPCQREESESKSGLNLPKVISSALKLTSSSSNFKRRKTPPPWFKDCYDPAIFAAKMRQPPAELSLLQPVPVSSSMKILFGDETNQLPPAPSPLPPINARLIFTDKSQIEDPKETILDKCYQPESENISSQSFVTLRVPSEIPPGPIAILDPNDLRKEVESWREKFVALQRENFNLEVKMSQAKSERKRFLQKIKALTKARIKAEQLHQKRRLKYVESITRLKSEINDLKRSKRSQELLLDGEAKNMNEFRVVMVERNDSQDINTQSIIIDSDKRFRNINDLFEAALTEGRSVVVAREKPRTVTDPSSVETVYSIDENHYQTDEVIMSFEQPNQTWVKIEQR